MSSQPQKRLLTSQEYLEIERAAATRSEFLRGEMFAMAGASRKHNLISLNIASELRTQLKAQPCEVFMADMRVKVDPTELYTYPDVVATCGKLEFEDEEFDTLVNPQVIFEVISPSTACYDRGAKFRHYQDLDSLVAYVLVEQDFAEVNCYRRDESGSWAGYWTSRKLDSVLELPCLNCQIGLHEIYARVEFDPDESWDVVRESSEPFDILPRPGFSPVV